MLKKLSKIVGVMMLFLSSNAYAYKECQVKTDRIYVGDNGYLWISFKNGGATNIQQNNVDFKNIYSMVLAAHLANKEIIVRFASDTAICNSGIRTDLQGVWLYNN